MNRKLLIRPGFSRAVCLGKVEVGAAGPRIAAPKTAHTIHRKARLRPRQPPEQGLRAIHLVRRIEMVRDGPTPIISSMFADGPEPGPNAAHQVRRLVARIQ